jgi:hypothetical protein
MLEKRNREIERELGRLIEAVAVTEGSQAVLAAIVQRETERADLSLKLASLGRDTSEEGVDELRVFVTSQLSTIQTVMAEDTAQGTGITRTAR